MSRRTTRAGFRRLPRIADQMTPDLQACVEHAFAAERVGDAATALEWHQAVPMFRRSRHRSMLDQLARIGPRLPPWAAARWIAYQVTRCEDAGLRTGRIHREALPFVTQTFHAGLLDDCHAQGGDPVRVLARVAGESWVFRQLLVHELGGLASFVEEAVAGPLAEHSELALSWEGARVGGYHVGDSLPGARLAVTDATGVEREVLDLGARSCAGADGWVVGRLVPSGIDDLLVFDTPPLAVPEQVAREVAGVADDGWWRPVGEALAQGRLEPIDLLREDHELLSDVPGLELMRFGTPRPDYPRVLEQLRDGRDEVGRAAYRILRDAAAGKVADADAPFVAAAALDPHAHDEARWQLVRSVDPGVWRRWAGLVTEPGRGRLMSLATVLSPGTDP